MSLPFPNIFHLRRVADTSSRACTVCFKPTSAVLVSEDGKADFFYICDAHLTDPSFATPQLDPKVEEAKRRQEAMDVEIADLKKKWDEYQKKKAKKSKDKKDEDKDTKKAEKEEDSPLTDLNSLESKKEEDQKLISTKPRVFVLNRDIYNMRLGHWRSAQRSKQTQKMLQNPMIFPKVPTGSLGAKKVDSGVAGDKGSSNDNNSGKDEGL